MCSGWLAGHWMHLSRDRVVYISVNASLLQVEVESKGKWNGRYLGDIQVSLPISLVFTRRSG